LLEAEVEFEHATKVAPVITEEVTIGLEETIKARILGRSGAFLCAAALFRNRRVKRVRHSGLHENETVATVSLRWLGSSAAPSARCAALLWASLYSKHSMS
jgi:U3 small nucleolar ribonucleoprotein component